MKKSKTENKKRNPVPWRNLFFELIVVFLGVTAGFLLNNWQLSEADRQLEQKYLAGFLEDVQANINDLEEGILADSLWLDVVQPKLQDIQNDRLSADSALTLIRLVVQISKIQMHSSTYQDITNSGNLNIISSYERKKAIVAYHAAIKDTEFVEDYFYQYFGEFVMPFVFNHFNVLNGTFRDAAMIKTTQFANVITGYYSMVQQRKDAYQKLLHHSYEVKEMLKKE
jgi:hypothetical protein